MDRGSADIAWDEGTEGMVRHVGTTVTLSLGTSAAGGQREAAQPKGCGSGAGQPRGRGSSGRVGDCLRGQAIAGLRLTERGGPAIERWETGPKSGL